MPQDSEKPGQGVIALIAKNIAILITLWLVLLFLLSAGVDIEHAIRKSGPPEVDERASLPNYKDHDLARRIYEDQGTSTRRYLPYVVSRSKPISTGTVNMDENGFRTHTVGLDNRPDATSIGFFGGSAMWGTGADDNHTIPAQFDEMTDEYEVTNYADLGWVSRQSLAQLINLINTNRAPSIVVFYDGYNDAAILCNRALASGPNGAALESRIISRIEKGKKSSDNGVYHNLIEPFIKLFQSAKSGDKRLEDYACGDNPDEADAIAEAMVKNWSIAAELVAGYGGKFYAFLQPNIFTGSPRIDHMSWSILDEWGNRDVLPRQVKSVYAKLREKLAHSDFDWFDLTHAFDGDNFYYVDIVHVSADGDAVIAGQMLDHIRQSQNSTKPSSPHS